MIFICYFITNYSEADPSTGWSKPLTSNTNVQYANQLLHIVLSHWNAIYREQLSRLIDISHDNAFLSYHPFEFEQRTLLARFRMNLTHPPHVQFIQKPVYGVLGMLGHMAELASEQITGSKGSVCVVSRGYKTDEFYSAILLTSALNASSSYNSNQIVRLDLRIIFQQPQNLSSLIWMAEFLEQNVTDPFYEWTRAGRPNYPDIKTRHQLRLKQVLEHIFCCQEYTFKFIVFTNFPPTRKYIVRIMMFIYNYQTWKWVHHHWNRINWFIRFWLTLCSWHVVRLSYENSICGFCLYLKKSYYLILLYFFVYLSKWTKYVHIYQLVTPLYWGTLFSATQLVEWWWLGNDYKLAFIMIIMCMADVMWCDMDVDYIKCIITWKWCQIVASEIVTFIVE